MARGGVRQGTPGVAYTNRSDLNASRQAVQTTSGQAYGARKAQEEAQQAVPLPKAGSFGPIDRPTDNPQEPVTAGLPFGPGAGPEVLPVPQVADDPALLIRAVYRQYPNEDLRRLIERLDYEGR